MPDGTGFKGEGCNGDLKVVVGISTRGEIFPPGTWAGTSWDAVGKQWGLIFPGASPMVERVMREPGRRIGKIAYEWSDKGVTKVAGIIWKRVADAGAWEDCRQKRMTMIGNVFIGVGNYKCISQNSGQ